MAPITTAPDSSVVWSSCLKTLPHAGRRTPVDTWNRENAKTIPNEKLTGNPHMRSRTPGPQHDIHRESGWESGFKTLDHSESLSPYARRRSSTPGAVPYDTEWRGTNKVLDEIPSAKSQYSGEEHWLNENFKTIQPLGKTDKARDFHPPDDWWAGEKTLRRRHNATKRYHYSQAAATAPPNTREYEGSTGEHTPKESRWLSENFKTLHDERTAYGYTHGYGGSHYRNGHTGSHTPSSFSEEDRDKWELGKKTVEQKPKRAINNPWARESGKTLPKQVRSEPAVRYVNGKRHEIVVEGTGWDSGLYKTIEEPPRRYEILEEWQQSQKVLPNTPRRNFREEHRTTSGLLRGGGHGNRYDTEYHSEDVDAWRSPSKTIAARSSLARRGGPTRSRSSGDGHWDVENRKTLPLEERFAADHGHESTRYVLLPRRKDMWEFHDRVCRK